MAPRIFYMRLGDQASSSLLWNLLSVQEQAAESLSIFKTRLQTSFFEKDYHQ